MPIFWEVRKNKTYADYSTNSSQSSLADLCSKMSTPTLPNSTKNPTTSTFTPRTAQKFTPKSSKSTPTEQAAGPNTSKLKPTLPSPKSTPPSTPTSLKSTTTEPAAGPNASAKATPPAPPSPIPETTESPPTPLQSQTTSKTLLFKRKSDSSNDGFNAKVLILEETLIGYVHNLSHPRRNRGNTMNYCTFVLQTSAQETQEALLYSTHKRPLLLESQNNHTPVKLKHFTYTEDRDKIIVNDMTNIAIPQQCEYSFQYDESTLLQSELITILDILNTRREWDVVTVRGKILNVKDQRQVGSPRKRLKLMEAVLGDVSATIPLDLWESQIDKVQQGKLIKVYI